MSNQRITTLLEAFAIFFIFNSLAFRVTGQPNVHVILISIDGLRPDMYTDKSWPTPNLRALMKKGVYADHMKSVFPAYTYPAHTAMLTGADPARSKICYNQPIGSKGEWYWESKYVKAPTLWEALHKKGMITSAIMWPGTIGADIDYNLSEIWDKDHPDDRATVVREHAKPKGIYEEVEKNATGKLDSVNMNDNDFSLDKNAGRIAAYIFKKYKPNFLALHLATVDGEEHEYGRDGDSVRLAVAANDQAVSDVLQAVQQSGVKESTTVIIVGDHGFSTIHTAFRINSPISDLPVRFINLSAGSAPISVNVQGNANGSTVSSLPYKSLTDFMNFATKTANTQYIFEFRDAASGTLLTTFTWNVVPFKNITLCVIGQEGNPSSVPISVMQENDF